MTDIDAISIPGYRIVSRIMAGGMATVYVAEQLKLGSRRVAIKLFRSQNPDHTKSRHKRFEQEAMIARNLQHPHIVQIFDYGSTDDAQYLVMEYLAHGDLKRRIREGLVPLDALRILQQIASALALLHQEGIVHRDIKPANILFREPDHAVLADFGIARNIEQNTQLTNTGFVLGTPSYMSPEQINGGRVCAQSDIYALGILLYEMLTGNLPYRGESVQSVATQHLMAPVPPLPLNVRRLQPLLNKLMAKKVDERLRDGSELLDMLVRIDCSRGFAVKPPSFVQVHGRKLAAVAALLLMSVAISWAGISQLPYWLGDAVPQRDGVSSDVVLVPAAETLDAIPPVAIASALKQASPDVVPIVGEQVLPATPPVIPTAALPPVVNRSAAVVGKKSVANTKFEPQQPALKKSVVPKPAVKKIAARKPSVVTEITELHVVEDLAAEAAGSEHQVAEQPANYTVEAVVAEVVNAQPAETIPAEPVQSVSAPAEQARVETSKKKLPPVISYF